MMMAKYYHLHPLKNENECQNLLVAGGNQIHTHAVEFNTCNERVVAFHTLYFFFFF